MAKLVAPDRGCKEADVGDTRYKGTILNVENPAHARQLRAVGYFDAQIGGTPRAEGFICTECGRGTWFTTCGKCDAPAVRP